MVYGKGKEGEAKPPQTIIPSPALLPLPLFERWQLNQAIYLEQCK